jgi:hypothetical protein
MKFRISAAICAFLMFAPASLAQGMCKNWGDPIVIDNYPRYGTNLTPAQTEMLRMAAERFVTVYMATEGSAYAWFDGHADFDAKGRAFERQVSRDRLRSAMKAFKDLAKEIMIINYEGERSLQGCAWGTEQPVHPRPRNEQERAQNRRVVISISDDPSCLPDFGLPECAH